MVSHVSCLAKDVGNIAVQHHALCFIEQRFCDFAGLHTLKAALKVHLLEIQKKGR